MKKPKRPPDHWALFKRAGQDGDRLDAVVQASRATGIDASYLHWDKLRHRRPPEGLTLEDWWLAIKWRRTSSYREVPLRDTAGEGFVYAMVDPIPAQLRELDMGLGGTIGVPDLEPLTNTAERDRYLIRSLMEEAITSSQLEGAATTREQAREMIRTKRKARDGYERMILNNYRTMRHIVGLRERDFTPELVLEIHGIVTEDTLERREDEGRFRSPDRQIDIGNETGDVFHVPPPAEDLPERMQQMCDFANGEPAEPFVHPVIRSIIVHFWLAYDHPFADGNGRTARALFYWSMLRNGYWLCEFISISEILLKAPARYGRAFLYTETDGNDLTYFVLHQLTVLERAIRQLREFVKRKQDRVRRLERELKATSTLNHRQKALIEHALRHPNQQYTMKSHGNSHGVVHQTARSDLLDLAERGYLDKRKVGRTWRFTPVADLEELLRGEG